MATIVMHRESKERYVLMGSGLGIYQSSGDGAFSPQDEGWYAMITVCDEEGHVRWFEHDEVQVVSVDGQHPSSILMAKPYR